MLEQSLSNRWPMFAENRAFQIQELTPSCNIKSASNPFTRRASDWTIRIKNLISRTCVFGRLYGQSHSDNKGIHRTFRSKKGLPGSSNLKSLERDLFHILIFTRLQRIIGCWIRFKEQAPKRPVVKGPLIASELDKALQLIIITMQGGNFTEEFAELESGKPVSKRAIFRLNPFMHKAGVIRVGGRLSQAFITYDHQHPIFLPAQKHVVSIYLQWKHLRLKLTGTQRFWSNVGYRLKLLIKKNKTDYAQL